MFFHKIVSYVFITMFLLSCSLFNSNVNKNQSGRVFSSSFESSDDFNGFYSVPNGEYDSSQEFSKEKVKTGLYSHKAWILKARDINNDGFFYKPHRSYPTIQLHKMSDGSFVTPCHISIWTYLDINLEDKPKGYIDDWFSFITLSADNSNNWSRTVLVNITPDGYIRLVHVPNQGEQKYLFQVDSVMDPNGSLKYPYREWVKIDVYLDFSKLNGYAKVWQNGVLISHADVKGGHGLLEQAHFGLYAAASISKGVIYNDDLIIQEVENENIAMEKIIYKKNE